MPNMSNTVSAFDLPGAVKIARRVQYPSTPPTVINPACLNHLETLRQSPIFDRTAATLPPAVAVRLENAVVFGNGSVMTEDGRLVAETLRLGDNAPPDPPTLTIEQPLALLRKPGDSNYGHWLVECLPRVTEFKRAFPAADLVFGAPVGPDNMRLTRRDSLAWYGVNDGDWINVNAQPTRVRELFLVSNNSIHSHTHDFDGLLGLAALAKRYCPTASGLPRIYVKRPEGSRRRLLNEADVLDVMALHGFRVVSPETMSLREQVEAFSGATVVVGVSGAALTNTIFCHPRTKVLTLMPNRGEEYFFWDVANIAGLDFSIMFGEMSGKELGCHSDFSVDVGLLDDWLASAL
jgi:hypothetical protein